MIRSAKGDDPLGRVTVVTPSYFSSFYLRRSLATHGLFNVEFTRIEDMAELLAEPALLRKGSKSLTRLRAAELVHSAAMEASRSGPLEHVADQPSFHSALHRTLSEFEAERLDGGLLITPGDLTEFGPVSQALADLWKSYESGKSAADLHDRAEVAHEATLALRSGGLESDDARIQHGSIVLLLVSTPAAQYRELWRALAQMPGISVVFGVTGDEKSDRLLADRAAIRQEVPAGEGCEAGQSRLIAASDIRSEMSALTRRILADAENDSVPFNRMAVLYSDPSYAPRIEDALSMAEIPVSGPDTYPVAATPAGRFVAGALEIIESDFSREKLGHWLSSTPVRDPQTRKPVPGSEWDGVSRAAGVIRSVSQWNQKLNALMKRQQSRADRIAEYADDEGDSALRSEALRRQAAAAESLRLFVIELSADLDFQGLRTWSELCQRVKELIAKYLHAAPAGSTAKEDIERVTSILDRIAELDSLPRSHPTFSRFSVTLTDELSRASVGLRSLGKGVFVGRLRDATGCQFGRVHIVGMTDGAFPSADTPDPLLPDELRDRLKRLKGAELPQATERAAVRRREFHTALRAAPVATLYWPKSSAPGSREAGPAQWLVEEARRRPGNQRVQAGAFLLDPDRVEGLETASLDHVALASDEHEYDLASVMAHARLEQHADSHFLQIDKATGIAAALDMEISRFSAGWNEWAGDLTASASGLGMSTQVTSASRVQAYATCPLRYFFGYVLSVEPSEKPEEAIYMPPDRRGSFIHRVLEVYLNLRSDHGRPADATTLDEAFEVAMRESQAEVEVSNSTVWGVETVELRRKLSRWLSAERKLAEAGLEPVGAEKRFGMDGHPPVEITLEDGTSMKFSGVIDRVDRGRNGVYHIFDYKTGGSDGYRNLGADPVDGGKRLQLALYVAAVKKIYDDVRDARASYWFVLDDKQGLMPEPADFDTDLASERLEEVAKTVKAGIESGHYPPNPGKASNRSFEACNYCDFEIVCPSNIRRTQMLKLHKSDPRLGSYFSLVNANDEGEA